MFVYGMIGWSLFGESLPGDWGTIGRSMLTLFVLLTLEDFPTYLAEAQQVSPYASLFFVSYVLLAAFVVINLLIGIVIGSMEKAHEHEAARNRSDFDTALLERMAHLQDSLNKFEEELKRRDRRS